VHGVATAHVVGGSVVDDGLGGAGDGGGGDVSATEVVHGGGVGPVVVDGRARGEHALVGGGHVVGGQALDGVGEPVLGDTEVGVGGVLEVGGAEVETGGVRGGGVEVDTARVGAHAGGELLEVVDVLEHGSAQKRCSGTSVTPTSANAGSRPPSALAWRGHCTPPGVLLSLRPDFLLN